MLLLKINYSVGKVNEIFTTGTTVALGCGLSRSVVDTALISKWNVDSNYQIWDLLLCNVHLTDKMFTCKQVHVCIWILTRHIAQLPQANPRCTMQFELKNIRFKKRTVCYWQLTSKRPVAICSPKHSCPLQQQTDNTIKHSLLCFWNTWHCLLCYWHTIKSLPFLLKPI